MIAMRSSISPLVGKSGYFGNQKSNKRVRISSLSQSRRTICVDAFVQNY